MMHEGEILRSLIKKSSFTQLQIAEKLGLSKNHFNSMLNKDEIKDDVIQKVCEILAVDPNDIFKREKDNSEEKYQELMQTYLNEKADLLNQIQKLIAENHTLKEENIKLREK